MNKQYSVKKWVVSIMGFLRFTFLFFPCWGSKPQVQNTPGSPLSMKEIQPRFLRSFHKRRISGQSTSQKQKEKVPNQQKPHKPKVH